MRHGIILLLLGLVIFARPVCAQSPLTLTISAATPVIFGEARTLLQATANDPRYTLSPVQVTLLFTNTGNTPLKLHAYDLQLTHLTAEFIGVDGEKVSISHVKFERMAPNPTPADFPTLPPGASWSPAPIAYLPDTIIGFQQFALQQPGHYRLRLTYANVPAPRDPGEPDPKLSAGCFRGAVTSNELPLVMVAAAPAVNHLQVGLDIEPIPMPRARKATSNGDIEAYYDPLWNQYDYDVSAYARNTSTNPADDLTIASWDFLPDGLQIAGKAGPIISTGMSDRSRIAQPEELVTRVSPGAIHAFTMPGRYVRTPVATDAPQGHFYLYTPTGFVRDWAVPGATFYATAALATPATAKPATPIKGTYWTGTLTAPRLTVPINLTAHRKALLLQNLDKFSITLAYNGSQDKPMYSYRANMDTVLEQMFQPGVQLTKEEAKTLIDGLAQSGCLRTAVSLETAAAAPHTDGYILTIAGRWAVNLGWDAVLESKLLALQEALPVRGRPGMDQLRGRLTGLVALWRNEEIMHIRVSLILPGGTLGQGADAILAALTGKDKPLLRIDDATRKLPVAPLAFRDIPLAQAFQYLAQSADINCTIRDGVVKFMQWVH